MNRIYQGRASSLELLDGKGDRAGEVSAKIGNPTSCPLWQHHCLFQDAVNYYLVALGALADSESSNRVIRDLTARLGESWPKFPREVKGASSLRDSLRRTLPELEPDASLQDAFGLILSGNEASAEARTLALALLLSKCGGDAAIQQGGRGYLPRFVDAKSNPTWDFSAEALEAGSGVTRLAAVLHAESSQEELEAIAREMSLAWTIKIQPGNFYRGAEAKARLREAVQHLIKLLGSPSPRLAEALASFQGDPAELLEAHSSAIDGLSDELEIPRNRKAAPDLTFASIAFMHFPGPLTQRFLKLGVKAPKNAAKASAKPADDGLLGSLGDDPIKLARGARGYVFPAFTALPRWRPLSPGEPVWKEFDIAAFKEALKSLNQFNQKTIEREAKLQAAKQTLAYMRGESDELPRSTEGDGEVKAPPRPGLDKERWEKVQELEKELGENLNEGDWQLSRGSLRGLRDIAELWNKDADAPVATLQKRVKEYQADEKHKRDVGSVQLFLLLCEERYRLLWKSESPGDEEEVEQPLDILFQAVDVHRLEREVDRFHKPIRLTPAEPVWSRRLFMFSDLTDKLAKVKFGEISTEGDPDKTVQYLETAIAREDGDGLKETRVRIGFTAPRLHRDELLGGEESRWLQPMTAALGLVMPKPEGKFDSAVALMPQRMDDDNEVKVRHLLNFPVSLDPVWIHDALGKAGIWKSQFNGTKDSALHLHWPGTAKDTTRKSPWWENPKLIKDGFTLLSNDLGQRNAGAWALLRVTCSKPDTKRPVRSIGSDGEREWFAEILATGMYRLPGEDQKAFVSGEWETELSGKRGRNATMEEFGEALRLAMEFGADDPKKWTGESGERSFPQLNDQLLRLANRRLSRLGTYHRWSCFRPEKLESESRRETAISNLLSELEAYQDKNVLRLIEDLKGGHLEEFRSAAGEMFQDLRCGLEPILVRIANRISPLRRKRWEWLPRPVQADGVQYGDLVVMPDDVTPRIRGQRGLSMPRLEQLEGLRRIFLRYNRAGDRVPGVPAKFGPADRGRESGEPCQVLLDKIERMKNQRVNQTAHLILAQALGLRLKGEKTSEEERRARDIHGEYEKIPGREPVDFIVIEDLSRYLSSQGRAPSENSRLMKWAHRAIRDKLKMLAEEPFGIPVVEVVPAYSSRFHAVNGQPGARLHELHSLEPYQKQSLEKQAGRKEPMERFKAGAALELLQQFEKVEALNRVRIDEKKKPFVLLYPKAGGPLFLAARDGNPVQADANAATNLGLRALAAPDCIGIHRRIRAKKEKGSYRPRQDNAREKAAFAKEDEIVLSGELSTKFKQSSSPNFFHEPDDLRQADGKRAFDHATLKGHALVSGVFLWSMVNNAIYLRCVEINRRRLAKWEGDGDEIPP